MQLSQAAAKKVIYHTQKYLLRALQSGRNTFIELTKPRAHERGRQNEII